jgi:hypothetical protein
MGEKIIEGGKPLELYLPGRHIRGFFPSGGPYQAGPGQEEKVKENTTQPFQRHPPPLTKFAMILCYNFLQENPGASKYFWIFGAGAPGKPSLTADYH